MYATVSGNIARSDCSVTPATRVSSRNRLEKVLGNILKSRRRDDLSGESGTSFVLNNTPIQDIIIASSALVFNDARRGCGVCTGEGKALARDESLRRELSRMEKQHTTEAAARLEVTAE